MAQTGTTTIAGRLELGSHPTGGDWLAVAISRALEVLQLGLMITGTVDGAINYARAHTTVGPKAWDAAVSEFTTHGEA